MSVSTVTPMEALRRLIEACKLIDYADCKDETVWQALGAAQGVAEGVVRDAESAPWWLADNVIAYASSHEGRANYVISKAQFDNALPKNRLEYDVPLGRLVAPVAAVSAAPSGEVERDAELWRTFTRVLRAGRIPGPAHGRRLKIVEICPMSGDHEEFNDFIGAVESLATKEPK